MPDRSPEEIRRSIEANRQALAISIDRLRGEVAEITDWRKQLSQHRREAILGAVIAATSGFLVPPTVGMPSNSQNRVQATGTIPSATSVSLADGTSETTRGVALTCARAAAPSSPRTPRP